MEDLAFAWKAAKHVKSNAIVLARDNMLVGMGRPAQPGQQRTSGPARRWRRLEGECPGLGRILPLRRQRGVGSPGRGDRNRPAGGSIRDEEVIAAANNANIAMVFTGIRHFRH